MYECVQGECEKSFLSRYILHMSYKMDAIWKITFCLNKTADMNSLLEPKYMSEACDIVTALYVLSVSVT